MLFSLLTLPVAAALLLDLIRYRRGRISRLGLWFWIAADALPLWFIALFLLADNTPTITRLMMGSIWLWMFLFVPRTLRAICAAVRLPRLGIGIYRQGKNNGSQYGKNQCGNAAFHRKPPEEG